VSRLSRHRGGRRPSHRDGRVRPLLPLTGFEGEDAADPVPSALGPNLLPILARAGHLIPVGHHRRWDVREQSVITGTVPALTRTAGLATDCGDQHMLHCRRESATSRHRHHRRDLRHCSHCRDVRSMGSHVSGRQRHGTQRCRDRAVRRRRPLSRRRHDCLDSARPFQVRHLPSDSHAAASLSRSSHTSDCHL
jgi:hypothetical protein